MDCWQWRNEWSERSVPGMKWKVAECSGMNGWTASNAGCWCGCVNEWIGMECWGTKHGMEMNEWMHWQEAHANNQFIYPLTAPWMGGGANRGYSFWGKLVAEKGNRPLESVGKVRYESEWDDPTGWILLLWLLIGHRLHRLKTQIYADYSWLENRLPFSYKQARSNAGGFWLIEWTSISYVGCWCWYGSEWIEMECWGTKHGMEMNEW